MDATSEPSENRSDIPPELIKREARRHERIYASFPVMIRSIDASGEAFEIHTVLYNFSAAGFYVRLDRCVELGRKLFAVVRLSVFPPEVPAPLVAVRGIVLRVERQPDGTWGMAVRFTRHRFI